MPRPDHDCGSEERVTLAAKAPSEVAIEVRAVSKRLRHTEALCRIDMTVPKGQVFALWGENGAGKTTLIGIRSRTYCVGVGFK